MKVQEELLHYLHHWLGIAIGIGINKNVKVLYLS